MASQRVSTAVTTIVGKSRSIEEVTIISHDRVSMIETFKEYFNDADNIFLEYSLPCKL